MQCSELPLIPPSQLPIYVINLKRSTIRRKLISEQLYNLNLKFNIFDAIDGNGGLSPEHLKLYSRKDTVKYHGISLTSGEIACNLSHIKLWEHIIQKKLDKCLILEDDALLDNKIISFIDNIHHLPSDWELVNLYTDASLKPIGKFIFDHYQVALPQEHPNRVTVYLINSKGIKKLLSKVYPIRYSIDGFTGKIKLTELKYYGIYPQIANVNHNIKSDTWFYTSNTETIQKSLYYRVYKLYSFLYQSYRKIRKKIKSILKH